MTARTAVRSMGAGDARARRVMSAGTALLLTLVVPSVRPAAAQAPGTWTDAVLQQKLEQAIAGFGGDVGVYVRHLRTGAVAAIRADERFPTASMIKVPILVALHDRVARGEMDLKAMQVLPDTAIYPYPDDRGEIGNMRPGTRVQTSMLAHMMLSTSDNTASLWLQALVGGGAAVNAWLARNGFAETRVNSRTPGREADRMAFGWGQTTPREMAELLVRIREGRAVSPAADEEMYRALTRSYWNGEALSQLPPWVQAASKQGQVDRSRSEVVLVNAPSGDYVFCLITKNARDERYEADNEGYVLIRTVSALLWSHFEPSRPYAPPEGAARLKP